MKLFISYCHDGAGLKYATRAKKVCSDRDIKAWVWKHDASAVVRMPTDIANNIQTSNAMLIIVTKGTEASDPQKDEWSIADHLHLVKCSIREKGFSIPIELSGKACFEFDDNDFDRICNKVIDDVIPYVAIEKPIPTDVKAVITIEKPIPTDEPTRLSQIQDIAAKLNRNQKLIKQDTIDEFNKSVWEGYRESALVREIVSLAEASNEDLENFRKLAIYSGINLDKCNAPDYHWGFAFRQLGREIAAAEQKELVRVIEKEVKKLDTPCNEKNDELSIVQHEIERLHSIGHMPTVILAPPSMLKSFVHFFTEDRGKVDFTRERGSAATLEIKGFGRLRIYLLGGGRLQDNMVILNGSDIQWNILVDPDTHYAVTMGIGIGDNPNMATFIVGTTIKCIVQVREGISIIPIER